MNALARPPQFKPTKRLTIGAAHHAFATLDFLRHEEDALRALGMSGVADRMRATRRALATGLADYCERCHFTKDECFSRCCTLDNEECPF